jgi:hypothetical protein
VRNLRFEFCFLARPNRAASLQLLVQLRFDGAAFSAGVLILLKGSAFDVALVLEPFCQSSTSLQRTQVERRNDNHKG